MVAPGRRWSAGLDADDETLAIREIAGYLPAGGPIGVRHRVVDLVDLHCGVYRSFDRGDVLSRLQDWEIDLLAPIRELSRGGLRRLLFALLIARDPRVAILDEPTDGLDPRVADEVLDLIRARALREDRCTLLASHRPEEVERVCDRVVLMDGGTVRLAGDLDELKESWATHRVLGLPHGLRVADWEGVVEVRPRGEIAEVVVERDAGTIAARLGELGATVVESSPLSLRELYSAATHVDPEEER